MNGGPSTSTVGSGASSTVSVTLAWTASDMPSVAVTVKVNSPSPSVEVSSSKRGCVGSVLGQAPVVSAVHCHEYSMSRSAGVPSSVVPAAIVVRPFSTTVRDPPRTNTAKLPAAPLTCNTRLACTESVSRSPVDGHAVTVTVYSPSSETPGASAKRVAEPARVHTTASCGLRISHAYCRVVPAARLHSRTRASSGVARSRGAGRGLGPSIHTTRSALSAAVIVWVKTASGTSRSTA
mmetsp:Transcript_5460/g.13745  ORF Transcript_5460/g.13745 Transcript_5460/m.13745 type:complete len:236 (+) Transcript_5460:2050-2757(+)